MDVFGVDDSVLAFLLRVGVLVHITFSINVIDLNEEFRTRLRLSLLVEVVLLRGLCCFALGVKFCNDITFIFETLKQRAI